MMRPPHPYYRWKCNTRSHWRRVNAMRAAPPLARLRRRMVRAYMREMEQAGFANGFVPRDANVTVKEWPKL